MVSHDWGREVIDRLSGVFVPATSPFDPATGDLDTAALRANLERVCATMVSGVVIGGTTGEAVLLTDRERTSAVETARDCLSEDQLLLAGTGAESTRETTRLTAEASRAGADAVLVQPPAYYKKALGHDSLVGHYRAVADESPVPVILYQAPLSCSTIELSTSLVAELSEHPKIVGLKDSRGDLPALADHLTHVEKDFRVFIGNGAKLYAALELGAAGGILGVANLVPAEAAEIFRSFEDGRTAEAGRIQERIAPLHNQIVGGHGVPGVKAALDLLGASGGPPRSPLRAIDERTTEVIRGLLSEAGFLDTPVGQA